MIVTLIGACTPSAPDRLTLEPVEFSDLPGWQADRVAEALPALRKSCERAATLAVGQSIDLVVAAAERWGRVCAAARAVPAGDEAAARNFLRRQFQVYAVGNRGRTEGLFTGYFEPQIDGAKVPDGPGYTPLLAPPDDLVEVELSKFADDLAGRRIVGRIEDHRLVPYWDRVAIETGALRGRARAIVYAADPIDAFFLQIQGSGRVKLPDGTVMRIGYAARNGRPYVPIGRVLVQRGELAAADVSMQSIRAWLERHPAEAAGVMAENPSYVFFRELTGLAPDEGPLGALGVPLTPGRSIAVDRAYTPLGVPVWVDTTNPLDGAPLQRLMLAQDVGGAIRGPVRGDIFFGWGEDAEARAGRMKQQGRLYVLLPRGAVVDPAPGHMPH